MIPRNAHLRAYVLIFELDIDRFVLGSSARRKTFVQANSPGSLVTIIDCITATGHYLDPGVVFKGKSLQKQYFSREFKSLCPDWHYTISDNGWTSNNIAVEWLNDVFLPQMNKIRGNDESRAILLILDGHKSHTSVILYVFNYIKSLEANSLIGRVHGRRIQRQRQPLFLALAHLTRPPST